jgi:hypothetical protein
MHLPAKKDAVRAARIIHMVRIAFAVFLVTAAILMDERTTSAQQGTKPKKKTVTIVGRVAAKVWDVQLNIQNHAESFTIFVISLESKGQNKQPGKFVQIAYSYSTDKESLPDSFFDYTIRYRFRAVRDPSCDSFVTDMRDPESENSSGVAAYISPARGAPDLLWNSHLPLDCYLLSPGKYKVQK